MNIKIFDIWKLIALVTAIKILLIPAYHSTDFEVHRNWLAITHNLPIKQWYFENTSEWTLDYPPGFAYFEYCLSQFARFADQTMLNISSKPYISPSTLVYQRFTVIASDFVYIGAIFSYVIGHQENKDVADVLRGLLLAGLLIFNMGLLLVDHIHFQYNGFLFGFLILSASGIAKGHFVQVAFWFSILLNLKHIYLYIAPAYFLFLLRHYCFSSNKDGEIEWKTFSFRRLVLLGIVVVAVFAFSFGPFIYLGQLTQVLSRLFPFKRGLCHAYWAPNTWALYNVADKILSTVGVRLGLLESSKLQQAAMTRGLVEDFEHAFLPSVTPIATVICTLVVMLPVFYLIWSRTGSVQLFLRSVVLCAFSSFMFGWHVHEKAVLMIIIPLTLLTINHKQDARMFLFLSTLGHFSLLPLIFTEAESPVKYSLFLMYTIMAFAVLAWLWKDNGCWHRLPLLSTGETIYLAGLFPLELYCNALHYILHLNRSLPFLPLLLTSVYCSIGMVYSFVHYYRTAFTIDNYVNASLKVKKE